MHSANAKKTATALTALLHADLRDARFSVTHFVPTNTELAPGGSAVATTTNFEETDKEEFDAHRLELLHREGAVRLAARHDLGIADPPLLQQAR